MIALHLLGWHRIKAIRPQRTPYVGRSGLWVLLYQSAKNAQCKKPFRGRARNGLQVNGSLEHVRL